MNKKVLLLGLLLLLTSMVRSYAQDKKTKEEKTPVYNIVIDDPMDKFQPQTEGQHVETYNYLVPEFYYHTPKKRGDTTWQFYCYDVHDSIMTKIYDYDSVFYFSLYKSYTDSAHTYKDSVGKRQLLPVSFIEKRYDKVRKDKWMTIEYPGNKYGELRAFKNVIVRRDTERVTNTDGSLKFQMVFHHYKLIR